MTDVRILMAGAFMFAFGMASAILAVLGANVHGTDIALQVTGRLSFLLFLPAYIGGAAAVVFGPAFTMVKQQARTFGLMFASAHLVHLGLVGWLCYLGDAPSADTFLVFGIAVFWTYLLALLSLGRLQQVWRKPSWWLVRMIISLVGLNYILYVFVLDFFSVPMQLSVKYLIGYLPFAALAIVAPVMRAYAALRRRRIWRST